MKNDSSALKIDYLHDKHAFFCLFGISETGNELDKAPIFQFEVILGILGGVHYINKMT
jgi:hypothetical protein